MNFFHGDKFEYQELVECYILFDSCNDSWRGFAAQERFDENIFKTFAVILTEGMEGLNVKG